MAKSEYATMLAAGYSDLKALRHMPDAFSFDERIFGFHAQQARETSCPPSSSTAPRPSPCASGFIPRSRAWKNASQAASHDDYPATSQFTTSRSD
jgi:hypothetical protein